MSKAKPTPDLEQITEAVELLGKWFPEEAPKLAEHRDLIVRHILNPAPASPLASLKFETGIVEQVTVEAAVEYRTVLTPCQKACGRVLYDVVSLVFGLVGLNKLNQERIARATVRDLGGETLCGFSRAIQEFSDADDAMNKARALFTLVGQIWTAGCFSAALRALMKEEMTWWDWTKTAVTAVAQITAWFATDGVAFIAEVALSVMSATELIEDAIKAVKACKSSSECAVCCQKVVDSKDEALYCEGKCQKWIHHYCAGVPYEQFKVLSQESNSEPFLCLMCFRYTQNEKVRGLENTIDMLTAEVNELRVALEEAKSAVHEYDLPALSQQVKSLSQSSAHNKQSTSAANALSEVVKSKRPSKRNPAKDTTASEAANVSVPTHSFPNGPRKRTTIPNARKIWGTLKISTVTTVSTTLKRLTSIDLSKLKIKRKFKIATGDPSRVQKWWFVVRGDVDAIKQLEANWDAVRAVQTYWKLEPVYMHVYVNTELGAQQ